MLCNIIYFAEISQTVSWIIMFDVENANSECENLLCGLHLEERWAGFWQFSKIWGRNFKTKAQFFLKLNLKS